MKGRGGLYRFFYLKGTSVVKTMDDFALFTSELLEN
jgi:hypothetical protein